MFISRRSTEKVNRLWRACYFSPYWSEAFPPEWHRCYSNKPITDCMYPVQSKRTIHDEWHPMPIHVKKLCVKHVPVEFRELTFGMAGSWVRHVCSRAMQLLDSAGCKTFWLQRYSSVTNQSKPSVGTVYASYSLHCSAIALFRYKLSTSIYIVPKSLSMTSSHILCVSPRSHKLICALWTSVLGTSDVVTSQLVCSYMLGSPSTCSRAVVQIRFNDCEVKML